MTDYITSDDLREYIGSDTMNFQATADLVCTVASRRVEALCDRVFGADSLATARRYDVCGAYEVEVDDISTTTGLVVNTDTGRDGTYATTLTVDVDFMLEPYNGVIGGVAGWPYTCLRALTTGPFSYASDRWYPPFVKVTAKWGWPAVPDPVKLATKMIAAQLFKMKDAADGFVGLDGWGPTRPQELRQIRDVLGPYMRAPVAVG